MRLKGLRVAVTALAVTAAAVHLLFPALRLDAFTALALVVALAPWLAPLVKSVELPGGFKLELSEAREQLAAAKGAARRAGMQAEVALAELKAARRERAPEDLAALVGEYERVCALPKGGARTRILTSIAGRMRAAAAGGALKDVAAALASPSAGTRLAAYVHLEEEPEGAPLDALVASLLDVERSAFGQYWALRALSAVLGATRAALPDGVRARLRELGDGLPADSDRRYEIGRLLDPREERAGGV